MTLKCWLVVTHGHWN